MRVFSGLAFNSLLLKLTKLPRSHVPCCCAAAVDSMQTLAANAGCMGCFVIVRYLFAVRHCPSLYVSSLLLRISKTPLSCEKKRAGDHVNRPMAVTGGNQDHHVS